MYRIFFWFVMGYITHKTVRPIAIDVLLKSNERRAQEQEET